MVESKAKWQNPICQWVRREGAPLTTTKVVVDYDPRAIDVRPFPVDDRSMTTESGIIGPRTTTPARTIVVCTQERSGWSSICAAWTESRPVVQVIFQLRLLAIVAVASFESGAVPNARTVTLCCMGWLCVTWSIYLLNGLSDLTGDRSNGSTRPLAQGTLNSNYARRLVIILAATGLGLCLLAGERIFALGTVMITLGFFYSAGPSPLKNSVCGVQVSVVGGGLVTYAAGASAVGSGPTPAATVFAAALSAWMAVGGLSKDLSDVEGDRTAGRSTLAMWSERGTYAVITAAAATVAASFVVAAQSVAVGLIVSAMFLCVGAVSIAVCAVARTILRWHARTPYHAFMYSQYGAHAGALCLVL